MVNQHPFASTRRPISRRRFLRGAGVALALPLLEDIPAVQQCHMIAGEIDLSILVRDDTPGALADLRERIAAFKGVDDVTTWPVLRVLLDRR